MLAANVVVYLGLLYGPALNPSTLAGTFPPWYALIPSAALATAVVFINAFFSSTAKARFVFLRWNNPLPGSRAFSHFVKTDSRIDVEKLKKKTGAFPKL